MVDTADEVSEAVDALSQLLLAEESVETTLQHVVDLSVATITDCDAAGVTLQGAKGYLTAAYNDERTLAVDRGQYTLDDGPCLHAKRTNSVIRVEVEEAAEAWPDFIRDALANDVRSFLAAPLVVRGMPIGALNLYSRKAHGFDVLDDPIVRHYAQQAATALTNARAYADARLLADQLQAAIASRAVIEQAKGILMTRERVGPDEAFALLRRTSQHRNVKLRDVAQQLVESLHNGRYDGADHLGVAPIVLQDGGRERTGEDGARHRATSGSVGQNSRGTPGSMPRSSS